VARSAVKVIVIATNTFIAAGWRINANARRVFAAVARRRFGMAVSTAIFDEYQGVSQRPRFAGKNYTGLLSWIEKYALVVEPAPLGKGRSRDSKDDIFLPVRCPRRQRLLCRTTRTCLCWASRLESRF